eukprot:3742995-Prymnesium_polylepis.3
MGRRCATPSHSASLWRPGAPSSSECRVSVPQLHVVEVQPGTRPEGVAPFGTKDSDMHFPPDAAQDFPVAMQVSN